MTYLLPGTNGVIAAKVSKLTGFPICYSQLYRYPDGEIYFRIATDVENEDVIIFNSMYPNPDQILFETVVMADTVLDSGANSVSCVFPYFAYARTIARRLKREAIVLKVVSRILRNSGISKIYFIDFHLQERDFFGIETCNLTAMRKLAKYMVENLSDRLVVVAPDENATQWAEIFAEELNSEIVTLRKIRIDAENVIIETPSLELEGDAVIVDDIISTGATVCQAARILKKCGCDRVFAACTHAILASDALMRMIEAGIDDIVATDTIPGPVSYISVAEIVAEKLEEDF